MDLPPRIIAIQEGLGIRWAVFGFLNDEHIISLESVKPHIVANFLVSIEKLNRGLATHTISNISTFFNWMIAEGRRRAANPVVGIIHRRRKKRECHVQSKRTNWSSSGSSFLPFLRCFWLPV